ncbi:hypothetical protein UlMin_006015 [Ulmus minor]
MITPTDNVLVAFSDGPFSRSLLSQKSHKFFDASRDKLLLGFGVGVTFIDERAICSVSSSEFAKEIKDIRLIMSSLAPSTKELHVFPIESVCSTESSDGNDRLRKMFDSVTDATSKEDLLVHLRMLSLQKIASENGYNRLVLGSCMLRIAGDIISAMVKQCNEPCSILPKDPIIVEDFCTLLPPSIDSRAKNGKSDNIKMLREQIQDCLLSDCEDKT